MAPNSFDGAFPCRLMLKGADDQPAFEVITRLSTLRLTNAVNDGFHVSLAPTDTNTSDFHKWLVTVEGNQLTWVFSVYCSRRTAKDMERHGYLVESIAPPASSWAARILRKVNPLK